MKNRNLHLYLAAWVIYVVFSMVAYPYLRVTVMLFSVPLTMLGGWFFGYKGAFFTTALTIPYHYFLLRVHSDNPSVLIETLNPFGIGSQIFFSCGTALLRSTNLRYRKLNDELGFLVEERTDDLRQLTNYLMQMEFIDRSVVTSGLLDDPRELLQNMAKASALLCQQLEAERHPELDNAKTADRYIHQCMDQLADLIGESMVGTNSPAQLRESIEKLAGEVTQLSGERVSICMEGEWVSLDRESTHQIHSIVSEAIANAIRHAKATELVIGFEKNADTTMVYIENNGASFPEKMREGMGLPLMRFRAVTIGGTLVIEGGAGNRTRVVCKIPTCPPTKEKAFPRDGQS